LSLALMKRRFLRSPHDDSSQAAAVFSGLRELGAKA
jgi:hypothetical protein